MTCLSSYDKWKFPDIILNQGEYLLVFASGKSRASTNEGAELHTNFKLDKDGGFLALYNIFDDEVKNSFSSEYPKQFKYISYGRYGDPSIYGYAPNPTPGNPNDDALVWLGLVPKVDFSVKRGFYERPLSVELNTSAPDALIRYTTDGSRPTETNGQIYQEPVLITTTTPLRAVAFKPKFLSPYVETQTYIFLDDVLAQTGMDPKIGNDLGYRTQVKDALIEIPTLSIVTEDDSFYIYANAWQKGAEWERPMSVELFYPDGIQPEFGEEFQVNAGIRMQGGVARTKNKISFRLYFRGIYGSAKLERVVFPDSAVKTFETLTLRGGGNRSYAGSPETAIDSTYTRDEWMRATQIVMSGVGSHGIFVHLYLNGLYWGIYNLVERPDASFASSYYGGQATDWYALDRNGSISGSKERYKNLTSLVNAGGLENAEKYSEIQQLVDIADFSDYMIMNWYAGNNDWPHTNWYMGIQNPLGQARYFVWDAEQIWLGEGAGIFWGDHPNFIADLFQSLIKNPDFKMEFADRIYKHLFNDGALTDENSQARWLQVNRPVGYAIVGEMARWGVMRDEKAEPEWWLSEPNNFLTQIAQATNRWDDIREDDILITADEWRNAHDKVLAQMDGNRDKFIKLVRKEGFYPEIDPPTFSQRGGLVDVGFKLTMNAPHGVIYYTTDGSNPRQKGGAIAPNATPYSASLRINALTHVKARLLANDTWSALNEATFRISQPASFLAITEIMYNPLGGGAYEFIELKNIGDEAIDLSNMSFEGIGFSFPSDSVLLPEQILVLASDAAAFAERYPEVSLGGIFAGRLSNKEETIVLKSADDTILLTISYDDENGWLLSADGKGDSLVVIDPMADPNNPQNWHASKQVGGSPGDFTIE